MERNGGFIRIKKLSVLRLTLVGLIVIGLGMFTWWHTVVAISGEAEDRQSISLQPIIDNADAGRY